MTTQEFRPAAKWKPVGTFGAVNALTWAGTDAELDEDYDRAIAVHGKANARLERAILRGRVRPPQTAEERDAILGEFEAAQAALRPISEYLIRVELEIKVRREAREREVERERIAARLDELDAVQAAPDDWHVTKSGAGTRWGRP